MFKEDLASQIQIQVKDAIDMKEEGVDLTYYLLPLISDWYDPGSSGGIEIQIYLHRLVDFKTATTTIVDFQNSKHSSLRSIGYKRKIH